ncbi:MAG: hypothetical protein Aurels2KO_38090 [Aureliella sp.]
MNTLTSLPPEATQVDPPIQLADQYPASIDIHEHRRKNLFRSLIVRWWYYAAISVLAGAVAFYVAKTYQSTVFQALTQVRAKALPYPPGAAQFPQPRIQDFNEFLNHPDVLGEVAGPEFRVQTFDSPKLVEKELNYETKILTIKTKQATPLEAADMLNSLVEAAIAKATEERKAAMDESLEYLQSIIGDAEEELAEQRLAKANRLEELRAENVGDGRSTLQYTELTQLIQIRQSELLELESELVDGRRMMEILQADESKLARTAISDAIEDHLLQLETSAKRFAENSEPASEIAAKISAIEELSERPIATRKELLVLLHDVRKLAGPEIEIPPEHDAELQRIADSRYTLANRLSLLPEKIERYEEMLVDAQTQRSVVEITGGSDFETLPEIEDLTSRIERAQESVNKIAAAIEWTSDVRRLDAPAYEQVVPADPGETQPDGDFSKLFVLTFGLVGLVLGAPMLALDIFRPPFSPAEQIAQQYRIAKISTRQGRSKQAHIVSTNPELRLLAHRLQRASEIRGVMCVLVSSLAERHFPSSLTFPLAECLAARQSSVLLVNLESFGRPPKRQRRSWFGRWSRKARFADDNTPGDRKLSLSEALIDRAALPDEVQLDSVASGIDRIDLGTSDLPPEAFAQPLMERLMDHCRGRYQVILFNGPTAQHLPDVQALAALCDGTLFVTGQKEKIADQSQRTIESLVQSSMPVLGIVEV